MLSILIISYGREQELFETLLDINKYQGEKIELLFLDNNPTNVLFERLNAIFTDNDAIELNYFHDGINYGVSEGRNYLIEKASGDILITLDDDLEIPNINCLLTKVRSYFDDNIKVGVLAFNIKNFYTKTPLRHEIPHGNKNLDFKSNLLTYYFIGAGHAIRKDVYEKVGLYPLDLGMYGGEERDLSFRILDAGYDILYTNDISIYHKVSPNGRMPKERENYFRYRNQLMVLNRYMPKIYCLSANIIWSLFYILKLNGKVRDVIEVIREVSAINKKTVSKDVLNKIRELKGRVWF